MKTIISKQRFPLIFLIFLCLFWYFYYSTNNWFNGYGSERYEWLFIIDIFISMPLICYFCLRKNLKQMLIKSLAYMGLLVLLGSLIIPSKDKHLWLYLESIRYVVIFALVIFEVFVISTVVLAIKSALTKNKDPDVAISEPIEKFLGKSTTSAIIQFDMRLWTFALFPSKVKSESFRGEQHFYCHLKDGLHSFLQGFVFLIVFEIPLLHLLLHFIWSPMAANIITGLTIFGLAFFIAEYRAIEKRPISITGQQLIIRYGLNNPLVIELSEIKQVKYNNSPIYKCSDNKRFNSIGDPNIEITLDDNQERSYHKIYLGLNKPDKFIKTFEMRFKK